jgi:hypothetical protein
LSTVTGTYTVNDVVTTAYKMSGLLARGQTLSGGEILDGQNLLARMLAQWNVKTWLVFEKLDLAYQATGQDTPYTVGPGGNFALTPRPDRIEAAYLRILGSGTGLPVDQMLKQIPAREQYAEVALKNLVAFSKAYFYDTASPVGNLFVYPWPQGGGLYEVHIICKNVFPLILPLTLSLAGLPPAAGAAMEFNLGKRLRQFYGKGLRPDPELNKLAKDALDTLRASQIQVPELRMPAVLRTRTKYNIYGDFTY